MERRVQSDLEHVTPSIPRKGRSRGLVGRRRPKGCFLGDADVKRCDSLLAARPAAFAHSGD